MNTRRLFRALRLAGGRRRAGRCSPPAARVGPNYERPELEPPAQFRGVAPAPQRRSLADCPWWQVFEDPALQALIREGDRQQPRPADRLGARRGSARAGGHREVVPLSGGRRRLRHHAGAAVARRRSEADARSRFPTATYSNWALTGSLSWEIDLFGRLRREQEAAVAQYLATEQGRRARPRHAGRRRRVHLLPPARARPAARDRPADRQAQRRDGRLLHEAARGRRVEPARGGSGEGEPRA